MDLGEAIGQTDAGLPDIRGSRASDGCGRREKSCRGQELE